MTAIERFTWEIACAADGTLRAAGLRAGDRHLPVPLRADACAGPRWYGVWDGAEQAVTLRAGNDPHHFAGRQGDLVFTLAYRVHGARLEMLATARNDGPAPFRPVKAGIRLGIDTYMADYPEWDGKFFPTLLRCEASHFWGYLMSPAGAILALGSPDPVASWSLDYPVVYYGEEAHGGHRVNTVHLDLLNAPPLPPRHPRLDALAPGEEKRWRIRLAPCDDLDRVKPLLAALCEAPLLELTRHTLAEGESAEITVWHAGAVALRAVAPDGAPAPLDRVAREGDRHTFRYTAGPARGVATLTAEAADGKRAEAMLYHRRPWSWYLRQARAEAVRMPQKATTNMESWLGCFSAFLARKHFPDAELDARAEANFADILPLMFDIDAAVPLVHPGRIQNTAAMIGLLVDVYDATGESRHLELAARLADWLLLNQDAEGAYRTNLGRGTHYTSVTYVAKYLLELVEAERRAAAEDGGWRERATRHLASVRRAMEDLERRRDNAQTEGEHTFEDGMISCTALQLALFALWQDDPAERRKYAEAARFMLDKHRCLQQLLIPDCRMIGGTLRFWESQYDVLMTPNMMNSPHGWSSWKTYAAWYLYLLTGEERLLRDAMDALGSAVQAIDAETGVLRWAFVPDPYVPARAFQPDPAHPGQGVHREVIIGEQYVPMISDWFLAPPGRLTGGHWDQGGCGDNDVHEHFKCLEETALAAAYVIERADGSLACWNCRAERREEVLHVSPYEAVVRAVHVNLPHPRAVHVRFAGGTRAFAAAGLQWLRRDAGLRTAGGAPTAPAVEPPSSRRTP